ncbi:MAG: DUF58 domain-containing protein [Bacteroidia bacterium]|nr:DUF58 domain-containing protein [Bacteroidia bacterium]
MKRILRFIRSFYFHPNFFRFGAGLVLLFALSYYEAFLLPVAVILSGVWILITLIDIIILWRRSDFMFASRETPQKLSNGDENPIYVYIENRYNFPVDLRVVDEIPHQFQKRDVLFKLSLKSGESRQILYNLRPVKRGEYEFGLIRVFVNTRLRLVRRRYSFGEPANTAVYPSFIQMRKYELHAISHRLTLYGIKRIRRSGSNSEFEKIKEYVSGDDVRHINWKATAKRNSLMVNQYIEERAQPVYNIIDMGRSMKMPFEGMTLLDYSINASLVLSNIALQKFDQAGLITFSHKLEDVVAADRKSNQLSKIMEALYKQQTGWLESNFEALHVYVKRQLNRRSLLLIYTNFESLSGMRRQLPYLRSMARNHVVVVIFFQNTELRSFLEKSASGTEEIYLKTIAEKFEYEKRQIVRELKAHGIYSVLTPPDALTVNTINKYLEMKASGII